MIKDIPSNELITETNEALRLLEVTKQRVQLLKKMNQKPKDNVEAALFFAESAPDSVVRHSLTYVLTGMTAQTPQDAALRILAQEVKRLRTFEPKHWPKT